MDHVGSATEIVGWRVGIIVASVVVDSHTKVAVVDIAVSSEVVASCVVDGTG